MKFGPVPLAEAEGAISAHSLRPAGGFIKKGQVLLASDIDMLAASGVREVIVARLEAGDVHEDEAAARLAEAMAGPGLRVDKAFTGRVNLFADVDGIFRGAPDIVTAINRVDEAVTVATLPHNMRVERGRMIATVKIIPYSVREQSLQTTLDLCRSVKPLLGVHGFKPMRVGLIATEVPGIAAKIHEKTRRVTVQRLESIGATLGSELRCAHKQEEVERATRLLVEAGHDIVLIFGASATIDRRDAVPAGVARAGGTIDHFGMPVDPGNLLLMAHIGDTPVIGAPGCARSPKENGFDWVLERLAAGIPVTRDDLTAMGSGGLLMEIESRPQPRRKTDKAAPAAPARIAALVLAAGRSSRMGGPNKLLQDLRGEALVRHAVRTAIESGASPVIAVTGHMAEQVGAALADMQITVAYNADFAEGLSTSLRRGLEALPEATEGVLVFLGDMPQIAPSLVRQMIKMFNPDGAGSIVVPVFDGKRGNPVLFARRYFSALRAVPGDIGARHIIAANEAAVAEVKADKSVFIDVDTPQALAAVRT